MTTTQGQTTTVKVFGEEVQIPTTVAADDTLLLSALSAKLTSGFSISRKEDGKIEIIKVSGSNN